MQNHSRLLISSSKELNRAPIVAFVLALLLIACSSPNHLPVDAHASSAKNGASPNEPVATVTIPLKVVADVPLSGGTTRLDYQSFDNASGRLFIAHLGSDLVTVFDANK